MKMHEIGAAFPFSVPEFCTGLLLSIFNQIWDHHEWLEDPSSSILIAMIAYVLEFQYSNPQKESTRYKRVQSYLKQWQMIVHQLSIYIYVLYYILWWCCCWWIHHLHIIYIYMPLDRPVVALCCGAHFLVCSAEVVFGASSNVRNPMPENDHLGIVYTTHLWWFFVWMIYCWVYHIIRISIDIMCIL